MMNFFISHLVLVIFVTFVNAAIIVQAPKYVQKQTLESLIMQYYDQLREIKEYSNKGVEVEIPVRPPTYFIRPRRMGKIPMNTMARRRHKRSELRSHASPAVLPVVKPIQRLIKTSPPVAPASIQTRATPGTIQSLPLQKIMLSESAPSMNHAYSHALKDLDVNLGNDKLRNAEEQVEKLLRAKSAVNKLNSIIQRSGGSDSKNVVYQDDVEKALKELEERLLAGERGEHSEDGKPKPVTMDDLIKAIDELEKNIRQQQEILATSTPDPCGTEKILQDALQPALQEDLWNFMKLSQKCGGGSHDKTRRVLELTLRNTYTSGDSDNIEYVDSEKPRRTLSGELVDMLQGNTKQSESNSPEPIPNNARSYSKEELMDIIKDGIDVDENPTALEDKGLIPIRIEIPKMYKDIIIKTD